MTPEEILNSQSEFLLKKGENFYKNKRIEKILFSKGTLSSQIDDGKLYFQSIKSENGEITNLNCTCNVMKPFAPI